MSKITKVTTIQIEQPKYPNNKNVIGVEHKEKKDCEGCAVQLSKEGKLRNQNYAKLKGVTSTRETWEDSAKEIKKSSSLTGPYADYNELMRLDEPETYARYMELRQKRMDTLTYSENGLTQHKTVNSWDDLSDEGKEYELESARIFSDWFKRRCENKGGQLGESISNTIEELEERYSDDVHDVTFNMYGGNNPITESMWRYNSKFSVMISKSMLDTLSNPNSGSYQNLRLFIDNSVNSMKQAELCYEGTLEWLRFGVKLDDNMQATYYANFAGCKESDGIHSNSVEDLLQMLTNYRIQ
jgi:hypothetical protein